MRLGQVHNDKGEGGYPIQDRGRGWFLEWVPEEKKTFSFGYFSKEGMGGGAANFFLAPFHQRLFGQ